jgi:molybdopterin synthase catalytic subunit
VSGGSGQGSAGTGSPRPYEITDQPISLDEVAARVAAPERGGITLFAGTVRGVTAGRSGASESFTTDYLEYEAYPEMAEASFADIAAEAQARWPEISAVAVVHRVGRQEVGDISIAIAVAAAHRADTFDACRYIIDRIKQIAPIWKREVGPDGASWVEGPESSVVE